FAFFRKRLKQSSDAIMLVELDDDAAGLWTRPDTWQHNPDRPLEGIAKYRLRRGASPLFGSFFVFWDGHYQPLTADANPDQVRALFRGDPFEPQSVPLSWNDLLSSGVLTPLLVPLGVFTLIVLVWSCAILRCFIRGTAVTAGEYLMLSLLPGLP